MNHFMRAISLVSAVAVVSVLGGCSATSAQSEESAGEAQAALSTDACPAGVPATLVPPATESLKLKVSAVGVQI